MDGRQFDRFTRELGSGRSRRSLVRGAAASIFGIGAFGRLRQEAGATAVICAGQDEECVSDGGEGLECCPGYICLIGENNSYCVPEESGCVGHYESCAGEECCEGYVCSSEQYCAIESPVCGTDWDACGYYEGDVLTTCCDGFECVNGGEGSYCQYVCSAEGMPCDYLLPAGERSEGGCCDGLICNGEGICVVPEPECSVEGESCENVDCCEGLTCSDDHICIVPSECAADGESCENIDCCEGLTCLGDSICGYPPEKPKPPVKPDTPVIELPNTGSGIGEQGDDWLIPGALGAAAAAIAAQKLLGDKAKESDETA